MIALHLIVLALFDASIVVAGGYLLWVNADTTVVNGSAVGNLLAFAAVGIIAVLRQLTFTACSSSAAAERAAQKQRNLAMGSTIVDAALIIALVAAWLITRTYVLGWFACFAAVMLMLSAALQLFVDVLFSPSRQRMRRDRSLAVQRLLSVEIMRLVAAAMGIVGLVLTGSVHGWDPALLNPLIVMAAITLGISTLVTQSLRSLLERNRVERINALHKTRMRKGREAQVQP